MVNVETEAIKYYKYFSELEGNQHIASEYGLISILKIVDSFKIKKVLELGLGVGSISYSILRHCDSRKKQVEYTGTEYNEFCLSVLPKYLGKYYGQIQLCRNIDSNPDDTRFDLVIIDGQDENLEKIKAMISNHGIVIIEGDRQPQLTIVRKIFPRSIYTRIISDRKHPVYGPFNSGWGGGIQLIFINPTIFQFIFYLKQRLYTAIKYRLRVVKS